MPQGHKVCVEELEPFPCPDNQCSALPVLLGSLCLLLPQTPNPILCQSLEHRSTFSPHPAGMAVLKKTVDEDVLSCHCLGLSHPPLLPAPLFPCSCCSQGLSCMEIYFQCEFVMLQGWGLARRDAHRLSCLSRHGAAPGLLRQLPASKAKTKTTGTLPVWRCFKKYERCLWASTSAKFLPAEAQAGSAPGH